MSRTASKSLIRSVYQIFFSNINTFFASSCLESRDIVENLRWGADFRLREYAIYSLKNNIGWIDNAGRLIKGKYPEIQALHEGFNHKELFKPSSAPESQPFLSLETPPTIPEPQAVNKPETPELKNSPRETGVVISNSHGENPATNGTDKAFPGNDNGISPTENSKTKIISASLHDGTLVVPNIKRCLRMSNGEGLGFRDILRIISQWRAQTHQDIDDGQDRMPLLIYVRSNMDPCFVAIDVFRRRDNFVRMLTTGWKLHHTFQMPNCSFVKAEPNHVSLANERNLRRRKAVLRDTFRCGLQNHVGIVDETGLLQMSNQPTIHEAFYDMIKPLGVSSTALKEIHMDMTNVSAKYTPLEPTDNKKTEKRLEKKPEQSLEKNYKDDDKSYPAYKKDYSSIVSATLHDGSLVVPSYKLCEQMSKGVATSFSDILRTISQRRTQTCRNSEHGQEMIFVLYNASATFFNILTLDSDIQTFRSKISAFPSSHSGLLHQPMSRFKLFHTPGTTDSSYVNCKYERTDRIHSIEKLQELLDTFEGGLKNHEGTVDETGCLRQSEKLTVHEVSNDLEKSSRVPDVSSVRRKDTTHAGVRYTPLEPTDNRKLEKKPEKKLDRVSEDVQGISMHDQIASTMKLAGALFEMSIMLNEEMSNAPSQKDDSTSSDHMHSNLINEHNPVFRTMKNGEIDIDAVQDAMAEFKTRLRDHQDKAQILARVCRRWKEELKARYPMMKRKSVPPFKDVDDLVSSWSELSTVTGRALKKPTTSKPEKRSPPVKVRFLGGKSEIKSTATTADRKEDEQTPARLRVTGEPDKQISPAKIRFVDGDSELEPAPTTVNSEEDEQPNKQQDEFDNDRGRTQPYRRSSHGGSDSRSKNDDGFSIFSW